ncbi:MAG TPA: RAMP superfamily CRISPR-associated protein [Anaerolineales bacterium]|nr:RAMP superfamily CRISPR-associated protein [Anaerolineales bacterium]
MQVTINVEAAFASPFVVGTGALADSPADKPTAKDGWGRPIIPGSSLKGRLRHTCEELVRALVGEDVVCHGPGADRTCPYDPALKGFGADYCPVCQVFGASTRRSPFHFSDLHWKLLGTAPPEQWPPTELRPGVSIRRSRRVAEEGRLFLVETFGRPRESGSAEVVYVGKIVGHMPDDDPHRLGYVGLLLAGLRTMTSLGGARSRGLGRCHMEGRAEGIQETEWQEGLKQWLNSVSR